MVEIHDPSRGRLYEDIQLLACLCSRARYNRLPGVSYHRRLHPKSITHIHEEQFPLKKEKKRRPPSPYLITRTNPMFLSGTVTFMDG